MGLQLIDGNVMPGSAGITDNTNLYLTWLCSGMSSAQCFVNMRKTLVLSVAFPCFHLRMSCKTVLLCQTVKPVLEETGAVCERLDGN